MDKKIKNILIYYKNILKEKGFETYSLDVELLLMEATNLKKTDLYLNPNYEITEKQYEKFENFINRRLKKEPIAYIIDRCEFMGIEFSLNKDTLIPRPDTEILVEKAIELIREKNFKTVLDIGTGSGAIAISIAKFCPSVSVLALDIKDNAIEKAKENSVNNDLKNISFIKSDIFENIDQTFDIIVSNPPYIKTKEIEELKDNVKKYEPLLALDGGECGLKFYENITENAHKFLNKGGILAFEIGYDQAEDLKKLMEKNKFININILKDLAGLDRVVFANII